MNEDQLRALEMARLGHSFLLTGQAGTGKTFTTKQIIETLKNKHILVTAYTGIASTQLRDYHCQTLNKTFGLRDGRYSKSELESLFEDPEYALKRKQISKADVLVIDEISMVSARTLDFVNHICQYLKKNDLVMGGIQTIFVGDFLQLPPVPDQKFKKLCKKPKLFL